MKPFLITLTLCLGTVACVNFTVDPSNLYVKQAVYAPKAWTAAEALVVPPTVEDRAVKGAQLELIERPDVLVLGSSRAMLVDSSMFAPGTKLFNAGLTGGTFEDYAAIWERLRARDKLPRRLILFADPWMLNRNNGQVRWMSQARWVLAFLRRHVEDHPRLLLLLPRYAGQALVHKSGFLELSELLSFGVLRTSIWKLRAPKAPAAAALEGKILPLSDLPDAAMAWRWDGSMIYPKSERELSANEIQKRAETFAGEKDIYSLGRYEQDEQELTLLRMVLSEARGAGVRVLIVTAPYHPLVADALARRSDTKKILPELTHALDFALYPDENCRAASADDYGCGANEFMDGMHPSRSCTKKIVQTCLSRVPRWSAFKY